MRVLGMISGTSHDGIDAAVVDFTESDGHLVGTLVHASETPYHPALRARLIAALPPTATTLAEIAELDTLIGQAFADVAANATAAAGDVDLVCSHGQTVFHWTDGPVALGTLQIGQPAWIAERLGTPVVSDVRIRDITAGGQGAPLVSFLDDLLLRGRAGVSAALNLGGISNMTVIGDGEPYAYDIGPSNALIDAIITADGLHPDGYDAGGAIALRGQVNMELLTALLAEPYYALSVPKSTGKELFHLDYVREHVAAHAPQITSDDLVATLAELTVQTVAADVRTAGIGFLAASGGGTHNAAIMSGLRAALPEVEIVLTDELGAPADAKEAILFALIGWCTAHGLPGVVRGGTGAREPRILGTITPGRGPLVLPAPVAALRDLRLEAVRP